MGLQRVGHNWATELNWTEAGITAKWNISTLIIRTWTEKIIEQKGHDETIEKVWIWLLVRCSTGVKLCRGIRFSWELKYLEVMCSDVCMQLNFWMVERRIFMCMYRGRGWGKKGDQMWQKHYYSVNLAEVVWVLLHCSLTFFSNKIQHTSYFKTRFKNGSNIMFCLLMYISMHIDICSLFIHLLCMFLIQWKIYLLGLLIVTSCTRISHFLIQNSAQ